MRRFSATAARDGLDVLGGTPKLANLRLDDGWGWVTFLSVPFTTSTPLPPKPCGALTNPYSSTSASAPVATMPDTLINPFPAHTWFDLVDRAERED
jgi:hypothetical protein